MFCFCAQSRRLARLLTARYDAALAATGISAAQFELLCHLRALPNANGAALAQHLVVDKTTLSRNLKPLLESGLVAVQRSPNDARHLLYTLTPRGADTLSRALPLWARVHQESEALLGSHATASQRTLQRMVRGAALID